jgi:hypothetical protein
LARFNCCSYCCIATTASLSISSAALKRIISHVYGLPKLNVFQHQPLKSSLHGRPAFQQDSLLQALVASSLCNHQWLYDSPLAQIHALLNAQTVPCDACAFAHCNQTALVCNIQPWLTSILLLLGYRRTMVASSLLGRWMMVKGPKSCIRFPDDIH